jgi:hypothetical protein
MDRSAIPKRRRLCKLPTLPDEVLQKIFWKLDFLDKVNAGLVCKDWDRVLNASTPTERHWVVQYRVNESAITDFTPVSTSDLTVSERPTALFLRCVHFGCVSDMGRTAELSPLRAGGVHVSLVA